MDFACQYLTINYEEKILTTGRTERFGSILKRLKTNYYMFFLNKTTLDITDFRNIQKYIKLKMSTNPSINTEKMKKIIKNK